MRRSAPPGSPTMRRHVHPRSEPVSQTASRNSGSAKRFVVGDHYNSQGSAHALEGCSHNMMLRGECWAAILVEVPPELFPAACSESQRAYRQYGESPIVLPTRARFA